MVNLKTNETKEPRKTGNRFFKLKEKIKMPKMPNWKELGLKAKSCFAGLRKISYKDGAKNIYGKIRGLRLKNLKKNKAFRKTAKILSGSGKFVIMAVATFLFFYYFIGSKVVENIDVRTEYKSDKEKTPTFETARAMSFLIKREIDDKMWTPNLPLIFPAYVLDNMPNFQKGIIAGVRDVSSVIRSFSNNNQTQNKAAEKAYNLLSYAPDVWLMSRKGAFNLAPSSNSQYRKAAKELRVFSSKGIFMPNEHDLGLLLEKMETGLRNVVKNNENGEREHSGSWFDTKADDLFYYNKGYAFALWQMTKVLASDYREILLHYDVYEEWTHVIASLEKVVNLHPRVVCNGNENAIFVPNHLLTQNSYLLQTIVTIQVIDEVLRREENAD